MSTLTGSCFFFWGGGGGGGVEKKKKRSKNIKTLVEEGILCKTLNKCI